MLFTQARFLLFFLLVFAVHWTLSAPRARKLWLLAASYAFYACWDARFLALLLLATAVNYAAARALERSAGARRRALLWAAVGANLAWLGAFKYYDFCARSAAELAAALGFACTPATLGLALPVGISFYTFQALGYTLDVHRGRLAAARDPLDFALFVGFFPTLLAGPILRATSFLPQLAAPRRFAAVGARAALLLFLVGYVKKACVADGLARLVEPVFAAPGSHTQASSWLALGLYHAQLYCDFSGYSDMALGVAALLGYRLNENFSFPYFARSVGEFWRRWHVSLSSWMRDHVYLPLVDARSSLARRMGALLLTMGLCGAWHGVGWGFVGFGLLHGTYLALEELWRARPGARAARGRWAGLAWPATSLVVLLTWPVFRLERLADAGALFATLFGLRAGGGATLPVSAAWVLSALLLAHWVAYTRRWTPAAELPAWLFPLVYGLAWALVLPWVADATQPFIYFRF